MWELRNIEQQGLSGCNMYTKTVLLNYVKKWRDSHPGDYERKICSGCE